MSLNAARIACFGGIYSNYLALEAALRQVRCSAPMPSIAWAI